MRACIDPIPRVCVSVSGGRFLHVRTFVVARLSGLSEPFCVRGLLKAPYVVVQKWRWGLSVEARSSAAGG